MKTRYKIIIVGIVLIIIVFVIHVFFWYLYWEQAWSGPEDSNKKIKEPTPLTMEQMLNDKQEPRERHEPTHKKGEYPPPCGTRCSDTQLQTVLSHCEFQRKLSTGEIPERNADGSYNEINLIGFKYYNDTHYIDNSTCEWEIIPQGSIPTYEFGEIDDFDATFGEIEN